MAVFPLKDTYVMAVFLLRHMTSDYTLMCYFNVLLYTT